jgi:fumarate reductase subunit C
MATRRPYVRPMQPGWWRRNPYLLRYMAREMTAPFVALYALVLLAGLVCLALGPFAWAGYLAWLQSPFALAMHALLAAIFAYHTFTWFAIMPKTMPPLIVNGRKVDAGSITAAGLIVATLCMLTLWLIAGAVA